MRNRLWPGRTEQLVRRRRDLGVTGGPLHYLAWRPSCRPWGNLNGAHQPEGVLPDDHLSDRFSIGLRPNTATPIGYSLAPPYGGLRPDFTLMAAAIEVGRRQTDVPL